MIALAQRWQKPTVVTVDEVAAFKRVFHVPQAELARWQVFNLAKQDVTDYDSSRADYGCSCQYA
jgi:hypothetical protein